MTSNNQSNATELYHHTKTNQQQQQQAIFITMCSEICDIRKRKDLNALLDLVDKFPKEPTSF